MWCCSWSGCGWLWWCWWWLTTTSKGRSSDKRATLQSSPVPFPVVVVPWLIAARLVVVVVEPALWALAPDEGNNNDGDDAIERGECEEGDDTFFSSTKSIDVVGPAITVVGSPCCRGGEAFNDGVMLFELPSYLDNNFFGESFNEKNK